MPTFTDIFRDNLDTFLGAAIEDRFREDQGERNEGPTEMANPQVISQPLHHSQFPSGQPRNVLTGNLNPTTLLLIGGGLLAVLMMILLVRR